MPSTCTLCKRRDAIYMRPYSGEKLCCRCFCRSIESKVRATIAKYDMLRFDDKIAIGVSGGKDSTTIFHLCLDVAKEKNRLPLKVLFVDQEAEFQATIDYIETIMIDARVDPLWFQIPIKLFSELSIHVAPNREKHQDQ